MMNNIIYRLKNTFILFVFFFSSTVFSADFPPSPHPFQYVNDYTNTLSATEKNALENKLTAFSRETSSQIAVVIVSTTGKYDISQYTFELGDKWGIGRKQLNNGTLMLIAKDDRKIFIAVGQGLEGALTDAFLAQVIRNSITPSFKQNQYANGINNGLDHIIAASKGEFAAAEAENTLEDIIPFLIIGFFILMIVLDKLWIYEQPYTSSTRNNRADQIGKQPLGRRRYRGGFSGGSFGGGGGFGGGSSGGGFGGGSFGGGGAGGSW